RARAPLLAVWHRPRRIRLRCLAAPARPGLNRFRRDLAWRSVVPASPAGRREARTYGGATMAAGLGGPTHGHARRLGRAGGPQGRTATRFSFGPPARRIRRLCERLALPAAHSDSAAIHAPLLPSALRSHDA